jgi:hypothetical protein
MEGKKTEINESGHYRLKYKGTLSPKQRSGLQTSSIRSVHAVVPENDEIDPDINYWLDYDFADKKRLSNPEIEMRILQIIKDRE